jgi:hypothetical protein
MADRPVCAVIEPELAAYALGALEPPEAESVRGHLERCPNCRAAYEAHLTTLEAFVARLSRRSASKRLRDRLTALAKANPVGQRRWRGWWRRAAVGVSALAVAGLLAWAIVLQREINDVRREARATTSAEVVAGRSVGTDYLETLAAHEEFLYILFEDDVRHVEMHAVDHAGEAEALYIWSASEEKGVLLSRGLPPPPPGMVYALWFETDVGRVPAGLFLPDASRHARLVVERVGRLDAVRVHSLAVTLMPAEGASSEAGVVVLRGALEE